MGKRMSKKRPGIHRTCAAFTLVEAVMACLVVSILLVSAMRAAGVASVYQYSIANRARARLLATQLLADISSTSYEEPSGTVLFGTESGETSSSKANYDDVDDFNGWTESPPQDRDGNAMAELTGWQRSVAVVWVNSTSPTTVSATETGIKRITVTVSRNNAALATAVAIKVKAP
jgi:MSHA pilin protein MshD